MTSCYPHYQYSPYRGTPNHGTEPPYRSSTRDLRSTVTGAPCDPQENGDANGRTVGKRENPHKYLLYKPTFSQLMAFLASGETAAPVGF